MPKDLREAAWEQAELGILEAVEALTDEEICAARIARIGYDAGRRDVVPEDCRQALANALGARLGQLKGLRVTAYGYDKIAYDSEIEKVDRLLAIFQENQDG